MPGSKPSYGTIPRLVCPKASYEVRVPAANAAAAEKIIAENPLPDEVEEVDPSSELDLETIASGPD